MTELEPQFMDGLEISGFELNRSFDGLQEGVWDPADLKVTPGAGVSISVAAGKGFVQSDAPGSSGELYRIRNDAAKGSGTFTSGGIAPNGSGNPRIDQIIARIYDHTFDGLGLRQWRLEVLQGVPTVGATLDNRNGAAALPNTALRLADVLIPNAAASIPSGNIRDRRPQARGAFCVLTSPVLADFNGNNGTWTAIDTSNLQTRMELSGVPVRLSFVAEIAIAAGTARFSIGASAPGFPAIPPVGGSNSSRQAYNNTGVAVGAGAGSVLLMAAYSMAVAGNVLVYRSASGGSNPLPTMTIEEIMRPSANNS